MAIQETNGPSGPSGNYDPEAPDGRPTERVPAERGMIGDGVDEYDYTLKDFFGSSKQKLGLKDILIRLRGKQINWAEVIKQDGGMDRLMDAANDPNHPDHKSAKAYLESDVGSRTVQLQMQKDARFNAALSNMFMALHTQLMATIKNFRV